MINRTRQAHGLRVLRPSAALDAAASRHTLAMSELGQLGHGAEDGSSFASRFRRIWAKVGENLAAASPNTSPTEMVSMWMRSPTHRANLLDSTWRLWGAKTRFASREIRDLQAGR